MNDKLICIRSKNRPFEVKMDTMEWLSRYANFYSPENVYMMIQAFKDMYSATDFNYKTAYVQCVHASDTAFLVVGALKGEMAKIQGGQNGPGGVRTLTGQ